MEQQLRLEQNGSMEHAVNIVVVVVHVFVVVVVVVVVEYLG